MNQCDIIGEAIKRYKSLTFLSNKKTEIDDTLIALKKVNIQIDQPELCSYPQLNDDESYSISVSQRNGSQPLASINSKTVWGMLRALESFSQMVYSQDLNNTAMFYVNETEINDNPGKK